MSGREGVMERVEVGVRAPVPQSVSQWVCLFDG